MARPILQIAGTVVGFALGGPIGASIGGMIGGAVGSLIDPVVVEGPRLSDLSVQSSAYGVDVPLVYGEENRVAGSLIWSTGLIEQKKKTKSGKGGGSPTQVTYTYSTSAAILLSQGVCRRIRRIWANKKVLWDIDASQAEVLRLLDVANAADAEADAEEAAESEWAAEARAKADAAMANYTAAAAAVAAAAAGGQFTLEAQVGLPRGNLGYLAFYPGDFVQDPDPKIEANLGAGNAPAYRGSCYVVLGNLQLADYGNALPTLEFELDGIDLHSVGTIVHDICTRAGMDADEFSVDTAMSADPVQGYQVARAANALAALMPLSAAFFFDAVEQDGMVRFVKRGRSARATIPLYDIAARSRDEETPPRYGLDRLPDHDLLKSAALTFRDPDRDYQENTARADRVNGTSTTHRSEQLAMSMDPDRARSIVDRILWQAYVDRMPLRLSLTDKWRDLQVAHVVALAVAGDYRPFRIDNRVRGADGRIEMELRLEDPFVYRSDAAGVYAAVPSQVSAVVGDTFGYVLNAPMLASDQDDEGFAWAMDAESSGWKGGLLFRSTDGGQTYESVADSNLRNTTGTVAAALPDASSDLWDTTNTITVVLRYDDHELESLDEDAVLRGNNAAWLGAADGSHGEIIQFATATLTSSSPKTYQLSNLLRGRRATEHETALHGTNEVFVLLEPDLLRSLDFSSTDWDKYRRYKGVSVYDFEEDVYDHQEFYNTGERKRPRSPVLCTGERDVSNNLTISWLRRVRGFHSGFGYGSPALDEATEAYEVDVMDGTDVVRTISVTAAAASYTAAEQTADGLTPGDPVTIKVYQLSATRGRGHAGEFTV